MSTAIAKVEVYYTQETAEWIRDHWVPRGLWSLLDRVSSRIRRKPNFEESLKLPQETLILSGENECVDSVRLWSIDIGSELCRL